MSAPIDNIKRISLQENHFIDHPRHFKEVLSIISSPEFSDNEKIKKIVALLDSILNPGSSILGRISSKNVLEITHAYSKKECPFFEQEPRVLLNDTFLKDVIFSHRTPVCIDHTGSLDTTYKNSAFHKKLGYTSCVSFPIYSQQKLWGVLAFYYGSPDSVNSNVLRSELVKYVVNWMGLTLTNLSEQAPRTLLELALKHTDDITGWLKEDGSIDIVNDAFFKKLGYPKDFFINKNIQELFPEDRRHDFTWSKMWEGMKRDKTSSFETYLVRNDGEKLPVKLHSSFVEHGGSNYIAFLAEDISEKKLHELQLKKSEEYLKIAARAAKMGIWNWDIESNTITWDQNLRKMYNIPQHMNPSFDILRNKIIHPNDRQRFIDVFPKVLKSEETNAFECKYIPLNTMDIRYMLSRVIVERNINGKAIGVTGAVFDITERKVAENTMKKQARALEKYSKEIEQIAYVATHDLKSPIANLQGFIDLLKGQINNPSKVVMDSLRWMEKSVEQSSRVIGDLTVAIQSIKDKQDKPEDICVYELVLEVLNNFHSKIEEKDIVVSILQRQVVPIYYSRLALRSILQNILSNAFKYLGRNPYPRVDIILETKRRFFSVKIKDNGVGMNLEKHEDKLFGLFQRINQSEQGSGMGMFIVKNLLYNYGGKLNVDSKLNQGSTFEVLLPLPGRLSSI